LFVAVESQRKDIAIQAGGDTSVVIVHRATEPAAVGSERAGTNIFRKRHQSICNVH
jgi:hypothetical protein